MSLRPPRNIHGPSFDTGINVLEHEMLAEKAASLGRAGGHAEACLARLREHQGDAAERRELLKNAAAAVHAYFIQRELCGLRRHDDVIRDLDIPNQVLVRLGAA
ncbi:DUF6665 family protein [Pseudaminobacter sp. NGMCC 1.201702]|uniref:DUF6665 family protein n=1 Tax=Pseudaminobacter sp. NGMCC 1.201702 TaxID=3391825 RepID=UPI0039F1497D